MPTTINDINKYLEETIKTELLVQKHRATGKLIDSLKVTDRNEGGNIIVEGRMEGYGEWVDVGRKKGVTRVPVQALIEWVKVKGIASGEQAKGMAFAIREKIYQEGRPTRGSRSLAPRRTNFIQESINRANKLTQMITDFDRGLKEAQIKNLIRNVQQTIK